MKYTHIFWDWNGTILDDSDAAFRSVNDLLRKRGMPCISKEQYYSYIDTPIIRFYEKLFDLSKVDYEEIINDFQAGYARHIAASGLMEGAERVLRHFHGLGIKQIIVSSCEQNQLVTYAAKFGISDLFDDILGASDFLAESKIERAKQYMTYKSIDPGRTLMIGDTLHDYETAAALGSDCILMASGHQTEDTLRSSGAKLIGSLSELLVHII